MGVQLASFATLNVAIVVLAAGQWLNRRVALLSAYNIPEPVSSGLLVCVLLALVHGIWGLEVSFNLATRDFLLLYFFAAIGLNADFGTLRSGGRPLALLVALTTGYMILQNLTGLGVASLLGLNPLVGLLGGSVSLLGGTARPSPGRPASLNPTASPTRWRLRSPAPPSVWCWPR
ncbi:sodium/glutamate symporter [Cyanobium sp. ATX-6F1]